MLYFSQITICLFDFPYSINWGWHKQIKEWLSSLHCMSRSPLIGRKGVWGRVICVDMIVAITKGHVYSLPNGFLLKPTATSQDISAFLCEYSVTMALSENICVL